jgi:hypothetical protein
MVDLVCGQITGSFVTFIMRRIMMCRKLMVLVSLILVLVVMSSVQAKPVPFSIGASADVTVGNDGNLRPNKNINVGSLFISDVRDNRRVTFVSFDISQVRVGLLKVFSDVSFSNYGNVGGKVHVYGVLEDLDNIDESITWNTAPGVKNDPTPPLASRVVLDMDDLTELLLTFNCPDRNERSSTGTSQALTDFVNADTDGIVTFLFAPEPEKDPVILSSSHSSGGVFLEGGIASEIIIAWVTESTDQNEDGIIDDQGWYDWLESEGHTVDYQPDYWMELDSDKIEELNAADLVIVSRTQTVVIMTMVMSRPYGILSRHQSYRWLRIWSEIAVGYGSIPARLCRPKNL